MNREIDMKLISEPIARIFSLAAHVPGSGPSGRDAGEADEDRPHQPVQVVLECSFCNGTGLCSACDGRGSRQLSGAWRGMWRPAPCVTCVRTGRCPMCYGNGNFLVEPPPPAGDPEFAAVREASRRS